MLKINPFIEKSKKSGTAKEVECNNGVQLIDCASPSNPYEFSANVKKAMACLKNQYEVISEYPQNPDLKNSIIKYWSDYAVLTENNIALSNGAIDGLGMINVLFHRQDACVLGISPQYTDYVLKARMLGFSYRNVPLLKKDSYKFEINRMLDAISSDLSIIYIDTPNNPTGQTIPLNELRLILDKARAHEICVVIDEAYGEFIDSSESAATLINKYENLIVVRSFSKAFGLSGIRAGYLLTSEHIKVYLDKISNTGVVSGVSRILAQAALSDIGYIINCREHFAKSKSAVNECVGKKLHIAHTHKDCPLMLLWHEDTTINLAAEFAAHGIKAHSGSEFDGLAANSVRLRLPQHNKLEELLEAVTKINNH